MKRMWSKNEVKKIVESGALNIEGPLSVQNYSFDGDIEIDFGENSLEAYYAHARVSNGKLNIVIALKHTTNAETINFSLDQEFGSITLPDEILSNLYPAYGDALSREKINVMSYAEDKELAFVFIKTATGIKISCGQGVSLEFDASNYVGRLEINYIL